VVPLKPSGLRPAHVAAAQRAASRRAQVRRAVTAAAAAYFLVACAAGGYLFFKSKRLKGLEAEVARLETEAGWIPFEQARWEAFQQTIDPDLYPLTTLDRIYSLMPPTGVRFKQYEDSVEIVTIQAEAQDTNAAILFRNAVANSPDLAHYEWTSTSPRVGRNKTTDFVLTGRLKKDQPVEN
jgi:hypothetical protein